MIGPENGLPVSEKGKIPMGGKGTFVHPNIVAKDWKELARFYKEVFGLAEKPPERHLKGEWFERATDVKDADAEGIHLVLRDDCDPPVTLEILQYRPLADGRKLYVNGCGLAHLAFRVDDVVGTLDKVIASGGSRYGEIVSKKIEGAGTVTFVYVRDPEGNMIELQRWDP
jgi:catechol 2,3-dioxygenase-like lactoylglutathione lyase family enzyme